MIPRSGNWAGLFAGFRVIRWHTHRRWIAWLAIAAMWLTIVAPVISQTVLPATHAPAMHHGAGCGKHAEQTPPLSPPHDHALEKCGYCGLLGYSPMLPGAIWLPPILPPVAAVPANLPRALPATRLATLAAAPRGPPAFAHT
ncbi:Protein of unknown function [Dyella sp. OK004]|uniref:DUF2946 domain-containing protein n=1 Tax=Dyella sp. OK004 TaxID=1855292 RepID=UPI0008EFB689|nr:DUF2946 domain-containing protein [Dyella sp. OK004]SFS17807.1 Protein of unknown function [Dyella sp. OK004]